MDLIDFAEEYRESDDFRHLQTSGIHYVPGRGSERPRVMLLGEAPGATENLERKPFVGASGRVLGGLMELAGLSEKNSYITNVVKFRPPGNRTPTGREIVASRRWVRQEWRILGRPPVIVAVGAAPLACVGSHLLPISRHVGTPQLAKDNVLVIWPMFHPAYALRNPPIRPECELHWQKLGAWLKEEGLL